LSDTSVFIDHEGAIKAWLKTVDDVDELSDGRVFVGRNDRADALPQVVVQVIGGGPDLGDSPVAYPRVQLDAWATNRREAQALAEVVGNACWQLAGGTTPMGDTAVALGARVLTVPRFLTSQEDEKAHRFRYTLDVEFALRAA
jgi:hypothetical protein